MEFLIMIRKALLCLTTLHIYRVSAQGDCTDFRGRLISHGLHYVPGPDTCTLCVCDNGIPKVCKAVLCSPPQDCRSFRVGHTCCEFICLDDVVKPSEGAEANVRVAAGGAAGAVLLTVALVVYRVRRQKRRRPPHADDQRSLTSIGYISGSMGYMSGTCETALAAWKPPGNYLPRGEAPPPYDEAVAQCRPDQIRMGNETPYHRTYPTTMEALTRPEEPACATHAYVSVPRPLHQALQQMANTQTCYNAPLLQPAHAPEPPPPHHPLAPNGVIGFPSAIRLTGSLGAISNRALLSVAAREPEHERPHNVPGFYTSNVHTSLHRTIPRISTAADTSAFEACFSRGDRALHAEVRRSFHRADRERDREHAREHPRDTGRSMPRNLNLAERVPDPPPLDQSLVRLAGGRSRAHSEEHNVGAEPPPPPADVPATAPAALAPAAPAPPPHATLPLTVDKPSCVCSYEGTNAPGTEDADDYRSECENCKSASSSRCGSQMGVRGRLGGGGGRRHADTTAPRAARRARAARHRHAAAARHQAEPNGDGPSFQLGELV